LGWLWRLEDGYLTIMPCEVRADLAGDPVSVLAFTPRPPPITEPHPVKQHRWRGHQAVPGWHQAYHEHHRQGPLGDTRCPGREMPLPYGPTP